MTNESGSPHCVEIGVDVCNNRYLAVLQVDGVLMQQIEFQTERQLLSWAGTIFCSSQSSLYVRLHALKINKPRALNLAQGLSLQGIMIGLSGKSSVCRSGGRRLQ